MAVTPQLIDQNIQSIHLTSSSILSSAVDFFTSSSFMVTSYNEAFREISHRYLVFND